MNPWVSFLSPEGGAVMQPGQQTNMSNVFFQSQKHDGDHFKVSEQFDPTAPPHRLSQQ